MAPPILHVLLVASPRCDVAGLAMGLVENGCAVEQVVSASEAIARLRGPRWVLLILSGDCDELTLVQRIRCAGESVKIGIIASAEHDLSTVVASLAPDAIFTSSADLGTMLSCLRQ